MSPNNFENKTYNDSVLEGIKIMCRVFWGPDLESCRQMREKTFFRPFEIAFSEQDERVPVILSDMNSIINGFETSQSLSDYLNEWYVRLFVNNKEGIIPLYQSCYEFENAPMMGASAVKMANRFESKGLSVGNAVHEPPDHLAIELEYLFFLLQEKNTGPSDDTDTSVPSEAALFASEILLPWVIVFNQRLEQLTGSGRFYFLSAQMLVQHLGLIASRR